MKRIPADHIFKMKESESVDKYLDHDTELKKLRSVNVMALLCLMTYQTFWII